MPTSNVESLLFSPIIIVVPTPMGITINAIVVAPQFWLGWRQGMKRQSKARKGNVFRIAKNCHYDSH